MDARLKKRALSQQKSEITEHFIYKKLARRVKHRHNAKTLRDIADEELKHYNIWKKHTNRDVKPSRLKIWFYYFLSLVFGLTFSIKLMERGERRAQEFYRDVSKRIPDVARIRKEEEEHEHELIDLLEEEKLRYVGSIVLGLNDALVELTGALAGLTLALQNSDLIAVTGLITGIAASLSMAVSEYLSTKTEGQKNPVRASLYTGIAYFLTVVVLVLPYFLLSNVYLSLGWTVCNALIVIAFFNFYVSVAKGVDFRKRFIEMALLSLGVALVSFIIGYVIRIFLHVEV